MYPSSQAYIALLEADEVFSTILFEYTNFATISSLDLVVKVPEYIRINDYAIELIDNK